MNRTPATKKPSWLDDHIVVDDRIDHYHRRLFEIIRLLRHVVDKHENVEIIENFLSELAESMVSHFGHEERMMGHLDSQIRINHTNEHSKFIYILGEMFLLYEKGNLIMFQTAMNRLEEELKQHIATFDRNLAP